MRLIDADALLMHLADIKLANSPDERESWYLHERALAVCVGLEQAMDAVKEAPTVYASDWMNEMMIEDERIKKEKNDDTDTEDSEIPE